jgi:predicted regulator of Ras-like GTPase activity (Roadblock/LC7/MglB family)
MITYNSILNDFKDEMKSDSIILMDNSKKVLASISISHEENIAAMGHAILSMCDMFLSDIEKPILKQLHIKTTSGHVFLIRTVSDKILIILNDDSINIALMNLSIEKLINKLDSI